MESSNTMVNCDVSHSSSRFKISTILSQGRFSFLHYVAGVNENEDFDREIFFNHLHCGFSKPS